MTSLILFLYFSNRKITSVRAKNALLQPNYGEISTLKSDAFIVYLNIYIYIIY